MSLPTTLLLGFIAGVTIVLGLPIGRMRTPAPRLRVLLNATAVGVLLFLFWDVCAAAWEPLDARLTAVHDSDASIAPVLGYGALFTGGIAAGLLGLVAYDRFMARAKAASSPQRVLQVPVAAGGVPTAFGGPENANVLDSEWFAARRLALLIAVGIGLHNFAEGLAIGQSAAQGEIALATVLVIGFALHNATEGFGIVAPLAGQALRPSWGYLLGMAAIAGGPTFIGTAVGHSTTSEPLSVLFLTLAAGSIAYVIAQLLGVAARARRSDLVSYGLLLGILAGFITDGIVTLGGA